jgi:hypothetical protein
MIEDGIENQRRLPLNFKKHQFEFQNIRKGVFVKHTVAQIHHADDDSGHEPVNNKTGGDKPRFNNIPCIKR